MLSETLHFLYLISTAGAGEYKDKYEENVLYCNTVIHYITLQKECIAQMFTKDIHGQDVTLDKM